MQQKVKLINPYVIFHCFRYFKQISSDSNSAWIFASGQRTTERSCEATSTSIVQSWLRIQQKYSAAHESGAIRWNSSERRQKFSHSRQYCHFGCIVKRASLVFHQWKCQRSLSNWFSNSNNFIVFKKHRKLISLRCMFIVSLRTWNQL